MTELLEIWGFGAIVLGIVAFLWGGFNVAWLHATLSDNYSTGTDQSRDMRDVRWSVYALGAALLWPLILPAVLMFVLYKAGIIIKIAFKEK